MNTFKLEIITPMREFLETDAVALTFQSTDGEITVLKGHTPMVASLAVGELKIRDENGVRVAFHSEGFVEVRPDEVLVFSQACEWPDEIDISRAQSARERAMEKLRQQQSIYEHRHTAISLTRAMVRLKLSKK
ncbi:MAG: ATP synthase F1 subunit epsilon [Ruminococcaceae bacterium]|nr:ATP synthase F1 subunit epsilon [Oscillospiraceae bacterium]